MAKYLVFPGVVESQTDGQGHYISAVRLIKLYGVKPDECRIVYSYTPESQLPQDLIRLYLRYLGNYTLPVQVGER